MANVLVIDDYPDLVELNAAILRAAGHDVTTGRNGHEGLESLESGPLPDCILLDVDMPLLDGPAMVQQMRANDSGEEQIPIVLLSGRDDLPEIARVVGTPYFVAKTTPDYRNALLAVLDRALRERHPPVAA